MDRHGTFLTDHAGVSVWCDQRLGDFIFRMERKILGATGLSDPTTRFEQVIHMNEATWEAICADQELDDQFYLDLETKADDWFAGPTMRYVVQDGGRYAEAAKAALPAVSSDDPMSDLVAKVDSLVVQVAEMRQRPSPAQMHNFGQRIGDLTDVVTDYRSQLQQLEAKLEFAKVALMDAATLASA